MSTPTITAAAAAAAVCAALPAALPNDRRFVVAIAGPPAAGKSTLAEHLQDRLAPTAAVLGLDAFHYDDAILDERGDRARKGAPHTFDVDGYRRTLTALRNEPEATIAVPRFDRGLELSRGSAELVTPQHRIIVTEGNYLLLEGSPWDHLAALFDLTVCVRPTIDVVEQRIMARWVDHGFSAAVAATRYRDNDRPNAELVLSNSRPADVVL